MKKFKKIVSLLTAAIMAVNINITATAEAMEESKLVNINGYMCYERDGGHWTMIDGIEYLVIDLDNLVTDEKENAVEDKDPFYSERSNVSPIGAPDGWFYCGCVNLRELPSFTDGCYISTGNCDSRIYYCPNLSPNKSYVATISTKQLLDNAYNVYIYLHNTASGKWDKGTLLPPIHFNMLSPVHMLYTSDTSQIMDGFALRFMQDSPGEKTFYYTINLA